jgi:hypothetical protein
MGYMTILIQGANCSMECTHIFELRIVGSPQVMLLHFCCVSICPFHTAKQKMLSTSAQDIIMMQLKSQEASILNLQSGVETP